MFSDLHNHFVRQWHRADTSDRVFYTIMALLWAILAMTLTMMYFTLITSVPGVGLPISLFFGVAIGWLRLVSQDAEKS